MEASVLGYYIVGAVSLFFSIYVLSSLWLFLFNNNNINTRLLIHLHSGQLIETVFSFPNSQRLPCALFVSFRNYGSLYVCYTLLAITYHCYNIMFERRFEDKRNLPVWFEVAIVLLPLTVLANVGDTNFIDTKEGTFCIHVTDSWLIATYFVPMWVALFSCFVLFCLILRKVLSLGSVTKVLEDHSDFIVYIFYDSGFYIMLTFVLWMPKSFIRIFAGWSDEVYYLFYLMNFVVGILYGITFICTRHRVVALGMYFEDTKDPMRLSDRTEGGLNLDDVLRNSASGDDSSGAYGLYSERIASCNSSFSVSPAAQYILGLPPCVVLPSHSRSTSAAGHTSSSTEMELAARPSSWGAWGKSNALSSNSSGSTSNPLVGPGGEFSQGHIVL